MNSDLSPATQPEIRLSRRAAATSLVIGVALLITKFWAYRLTRSQAVFSDALESIVNVVAALLAIVVVIIANRPADKDHPYGHGKVEFFSAAFEGGLIAFAAILIVVEAVQAFLDDRVLHELGTGVALVLGAGFINLLLGLFMLRTGRKVHSPALTASGKHVISDFWTSVGVTIGLLLVHFTGYVWLDPLMAAIVGLLLAQTGVGLVRRSVGGLLDEEDREILSSLASSIERERNAGIIQVHYARIIRSGRRHHIDAHVVVPEFWDVAEAHLETEQFEVRLMQSYPYSGELHLHVDPCRRAYCRHCEVSACPIRAQPFSSRRYLTVDELTNPQEPEQFAAT